MSFHFIEAWDGNVTQLNLSEVHFQVTTEIVTWELTDIATGGEVGCTEMVIANEGQSYLDVDATLSGGGLPISPGVVSVTLAPGGSVTVPICVIAVVGQSSYKNVQVTAIAQGRETNTQLNQVNKNAGFTVIISPYAHYDVVGLPSRDIYLPSWKNDCLGNSTVTLYFVVVNYGNYVNTVQLRISNLQELEDAGFSIAFYHPESAPQFDIDAAGEAPVIITVNSTDVEDTETDYPLTLNVSNTLEGDDTSAENTTVMKFTDCQEEKETVDKDDSQKDKDNLTSSDEGGPYEGDDAGECSDEADNDRDGLFDCDDEGCLGSPACKVSDSPTEDSRLPSLSLLAVVTMLGIISILRRR